MNRFWVRTAVLCGLLGAAGVAWGVLECAMFTKNAYNYLFMDGPKSNAAFAYPIAIILTLSAAWLAVLCVFRDPWKAGEALIALLMPMGIIMLGFMIAPLFATLDRSEVWEYTMGGIILGVLVFFIAIAIRHRKRSLVLPKPPKPDCRQGTVSFLLFLCALLGWMFWVAHGGDDKFYRMCAFGGLSIPTAFQMSDLANLSLRGWFVGALLSGALAGVCIGYFLSMAHDQTVSTSHQLRTSLMSAAAGMLISGLMYAANAVLLLQSYAVALNGGMLLPIALAISGVLGVCFGFMLALAVHIVSASEPAVRRHRFLQSLVIIVPMVVLAFGYALSFVRTSSAGLTLLQHAARLEGQTADVGFSSITSDMLGSEHPRQRQVIVMGKGKLYTNKLQSTSLDTTAACKQLLSQYPHSAFTSAALYVLSQAYHAEWQPSHAAKAISELQSRFPYHRYDSSGLSSYYWLSDLMLIGDYQEALDALKTTKGARLEDSRNGIKAYASEVLGKWDEAVEARQAMLSSYAKDEKPSAGTMTRLKTRLQHAQSMQARRAGAMPRTNVTGRLIFDSRPLTRATVCLIPSERVSPDDHTISPASAGTRGGRIGYTDASGRFSIARIPSRSYAVVLIVDSTIVKKTVKVRAPGLPYDIKGRSMVLPDIHLSN